MAIRRFQCVIWLALFLAGCGTLQRTPYIAADATRPNVLDLSDLRYFADDPGTRFQKLRPPVAIDGEISYLALSGGGADGAFGAGVLTGLSEAGARPRFSAVSGVSTGALIAPFAFLGPQYDGMLKELYTSGIAASLVEGQGPLSILSTAGPFANNRLKQLVDRYVDDKLLRAIATESAKGRMLFVITTNLDTQRTNIWNMGKIAEVGTPQALQLFRNVLTASASIPIVFPPVLIEAEANGRHFQEMHVDGGVTSPILTLPEAFLFRGGSLPGPPVHLYVLINNRIDHDFQVVRGDTRAIATRSASTLVKVQTRTTIFESYNFTRRHGLKFNLAYIGNDFAAAGADDFSTGYMRSLFQYGRQRARLRQVWVHQPPPEGPCASTPAADCGQQRLAGF
ncbi:patatin-like phospholipase family protein [Mesorhizobium sp.]|uniref:patatin-like phospholipase family protein n=1 Tax=Mesorhizobium sp. TaxID=1871066 RepID=UPI0025FA87E2|nr:patatin-like phospholipase family protein [Mesorhizobium sp.]